MSLTRMQAYKNLVQHAQFLSQTRISDLQKKPIFAIDEFVASTDNIKLDFHNQKINTKTLELLHALSDTCRVPEKIQAMFLGEKINNSENRQALHVALRMPKETTLNINNKNIINDINAAKQQIRDYSNRIRTSNWTGYSNKPITDVVNIGIGGSHLGPQFCFNALYNYKIKTLNFHFISEIDPFLFHKTIANLNPETTLFIISSKSFTTAETIYNAMEALKFINQPEHINKHFIAITANVLQAKALGFNNIIPIWDWVGGRYSSTSAINLITAISIGYENFNKFLSGAHLMDNHFKTAPFKHNLPLLMALIGIWNNNFLNINNHLILTYCHLIEDFVSFAQQLDMESNGKSVNLDGQPIDYPTAPIVWGGSGNKAQHTYYQQLCQGGHKFTGDLISIQSLKNLSITKLCHAHLRVLVKGVVTNNSVTNIKGNNPLNHISLRALIPEAIGELIALYEHKTFVQGIIWNINSFDQPGVESSKNILRQQQSEKHLEEII